MKYVWSAAEDLYGITTALAIGMQAIGFTFKFFLMAKVGNLVTVMKSDVDNGDPKQHQVTIQGCIRLQESEAAQGGSSQCHPSFGWGDKCW